MSIDPKLTKVYSLSSPDECVDAYRDWAEGYEADVVDLLGYVAPRVATETFTRFADASMGPVLDAGCGTGLVGMELAARGFTVIDGLDISPDMLGQARDKDVYRALLEADMTRPLVDLEDNAYEAVISVGTFTHGHVGTEALPELLRITRPGGIVCLTINEGVYADFGFDSAFADLERAGAAEVLENKGADYLTRQGIGCRLTTLRAA